MPEEKNENELLRDVTTIRRERRRSGRRSWRARRRCAIIARRRLDRARDRLALDPCRVRSKIFQYRARGQWIYENIPEKALDKIEIRSNGGLT